MKTIREVMTHDVRLVAPEDDLRSAAQAMAEADCGALPVGKNDRLLGVLTDRDITLRVIATGIAPEQCTVGDIMSVGIKYVYDDESIEAAARNMATLQMRRLPVLNREKRLVGIVSLADLASENGAAARHAMRGVSHRSRRAHKQEEHLDNALAESFPASDPVSLTNPSIGVKRPHARKKAE